MDFREKDNKANVDLDKGVEQSVDAAPALQVDVAGIEDTKLSGSTNSLYPVTSTDVAVYVPSQAAYPGFFMVSATDTSPTASPLQDGYVFRKENESDSWKQTAYWSFISNTPLPKIALDAFGYATAVDAEAPLATPPSKIGQAYVDLLGAYTTGQLPAGSPFVSNTDTAGVLKRLHDKLAAAKAKGGNVQRTMKTTAQPVYALQVEGGGALVISIDEGTEITTAGPGLVFIQDSSRKGFGGLLPPGDYTSTTSHSFYFLATVDPPANTPAPALNVLGLFSGRDTYTGKKA
ncbi:MAG: hypothetical protein QOE92_1636 [Chloroflexota bacterium]|jgi:hypothetical protein|nr:hypothetical protein [Chloroflexota bacterium]